MATAGCQKKREKWGVPLRTNEVAHYYSNFINMVAKTTVRQIRGAVVPSLRRSSCSGENFTTNSSSTVVQSGEKNSNDAKQSQGASVVKIRWEVLSTFWACQRKMEPKNDQISWRVVESFEFNFKT